MSSRSEEQKEREPLRGEVTQALDVPLPLYFTSGTEEEFENHTRRELFRREHGNRVVDSVRFGVSRCSVSRSQDVSAWIHDQRDPAGR